MPTNLSLKGGGTTRRPGVYGNIDASSLDQVSLETNVVALVGDWPFLEKAVPLSVSSPRTMIELQPLYEDLGLAAKLLWNSANDDRVLGGPSRVILLNTKPVTQASLILADSTSADSIKLKSNKWGFTGNQVSASVTVVGSTFTFVIGWNGDSEEFEFDGAIGMDLEYTGSDASTMTARYDTTDGLVVSFTKTGIALATDTTYDFAFDGPISFDPSTAPGASESFTVTVRGTTLAGGPGQTETISWADAEDATKETTAHFTAVTGIDFEKSAGAATPTFDMFGDSFDLSPSNYATVESFVDRINNFANFTASSGSPKTAKIPSDELDEFSAVSIAAGAIDLNAFQYTIMQQLASSSLVTPEREGDKPPVTAATAYLGGGSETSTAGTDWDDAFNALRSETPQIIWIDSTSVSIAQKLRDHCKYMAGQGGSECQGWFGQASNQTFDQTKANSADLNSRHLWGLCYQEVDVVNPAGATVRKGPEWLALIGCGMQAGTDVATPLTRKRPNVVEVYENSTMKSDLEANRNLGFGLFFLTKDRLGLKVERSITTYQEDDNPVYSEGSAVESVNTSIRDIRNNLQNLIGNPTSTATKGRIRSITLNRLLAQKQQGIIKDFLTDSVGVDDLGDTFRVSYTVAPVEPINFIQIEANVSRIAS